MKTDKRITKLYEAVTFLFNKFDKKVIVSDIATDHGYLAEKLSKDKFIEKVIATDISEKSLNKLQKLIKLNNLKNIETYVGDGLKPINATDIAVIAGVGGFEIIKMISKQNKTTNYENKCRYFVLQPAQNVVELRNYIFSNKICLLKDYVIEDAERFYPILIIDVENRQRNKKNIYNMYLGRDNNLKDIDFVKFLKDSLEYLKFIEKIPKKRIWFDRELRKKYKLKLLIEKLI